MNSCQSHLMYINRCLVLIENLSVQSFPETKIILQENLVQLDTFKKQAITDGSAGHLLTESFEMNHKALQLLLEYPEIFVLKDPDRFRKACKILFENLKSLILQSSLP